MDLTFFLRKSAVKLGQNLHYFTLDSALEKPVLWIRICFNANPDPDPAFWVNVDSDPGFR
jgi:hypothetical protein